VRFPNIVRDYCQWAEGEPADALAEARTARKLLAELYRRAIDLRDFAVGDGEPEAPEIPLNDYLRVRARFAALPVSHYSTCFNPFAVPPEPPVRANLPGDLADIWRDLKGGLALFEADAVAAAMWEWQFRFESHWAHHACAAIYALQVWLSEHDVKS